MIRVSDRDLHKVDGKKWIKSEDVLSIH